MFRISISLIVLVLLFSTVSCKKSLEDDKKFAEEVLIEKYLLAKKLDYTKVNGVYHVIIDTSELAFISKGNTITFWYKSYNLKGKIFDTNIKTEAINAKLDTNIRSLEPFQVKIGVGKLIKGLELGMLQLKNGEHGLILFPSILGYGDNSLGPLDPWTSLVFDIEIVSVE